MSRWPQFSIRSIFLLTTFCVLALAASRALNLSLVHAACAIISFPAFFVGPMLVIWGIFDWRPVGAHRRAPSSRVGLLVEASAESW